MNPQFRTWIKMGKLDLLFQTLESHSYQNPEHNYTVLLMFQRFNALKFQALQGTITNREYQAELAQVSGHAMKFLDLTEKERATGDSEYEKLFPEVVGDHLFTFDGPIKVIHNKKVESSPLPVFRTTIQNRANFPVTVTKVLIAVEERKERMVKSTGRLLPGAYWDIFLQYGLHAYLPDSPIFILGGDVFTLDIRLSILEGDQYVDPEGIAEVKHMIFYADVPDEEL